MTRSSSSFKVRLTLFVTSYQLVRNQSSGVWRGLEANKPAFSVYCVSLPIHIESLLRLRHHIQDFRQEQSFIEIKDDASIIVSRILSVRFGGQSLYNFSRSLHAPAVFFFQYFSIFTTLENFSLTHSLARHKTRLCSCALIHKNLTFNTQKAELS